MSGHRSVSALGSVWMKPLQLSRHWACPAKRRAPQSRAAAYARPDDLRRGEGPAPRGGPGVANPAMRLKRARRAREGVVGRGRRAVARVMDGRKALGAEPEGRRAAPAGAGTGCCARALRRRPARARAACPARRAAGSRRARAWRDPRPGASGIWHARPPAAPARALGARRPRPPPGARPRPSHFRPRAQEPARSS